MKSFWQKKLQIKQRCIRKQAFSSSYLLKTKCVCVCPVYCIFIQAIFVKHFVFKSAAELNPCVLLSKAFNKQKLTELMKF